MKLSDLSFILTMYTGIDNMQRTILHNLYLRKSSRIWLIVSMIFNIITVSTTYVLLFVLHVKLLFAVIIITLIMLLTLFINIVSRRYDYELRETTEKLIRYYGVYPEKLATLLEENTGTMVRGESLPSDCKKMEMEYLNQKFAKK